MNNEGSMIRKISWDRREEIAKKIRLEAGSDEAAGMYAEIILRGDPDTAPSAALYLYEKRLDRLDQRRAKQAAYDEARAWFSWLESLHKSAANAPPNPLAEMAISVPPGHGKVRKLWDDFLLPTVFETIFDVSYGREASLYAPTGKGKSHTGAHGSGEWLRSKPNRYVIHNINQLHFEDPELRERAFELQYVSELFRKTAEILLEDPDAEILVIIDEAAQTLLTEAGSTEEIKMVNKIRGFKRKFNWTIWWLWQEWDQIFPTLRNQENTTITQMRKETQSTINVRYKPEGAQDWINQTFEGIPGLEGTGISYNHKGLTSMQIDIDFGVFVRKFTAINPQTPMEVARAMLDILEDKEVYFPEFHSRWGFPTDEEDRSARKASAFALHKSTILENPAEFRSEKGFSPSLIESRLGVPSRAAQTLSADLNQQFKVDLTWIQNKSESFRDPATNSYTVERLIEKGGFLPEYAEVLASKLP